MVFFSSTPLWSIHHLLWPEPEPFMSLITKQQSSKNNNKKSKNNKKQKQAGILQNEPVN